MTETLQEYFDLFNKKAFGHLPTIMPDGSPQGTSVRVDYDGKPVCFNSARGRAKDKNVRRKPRVAISIQDPGIHRGKPLVCSADEGRVI
jgi:hypothetical protein